MTRYEKIIKNIVECDTTDQLELVSKNIIEEEKYKQISTFEAEKLLGMTELWQKKLLPIIATLKETQEEGQTIIPISLILKSLAE